jgi:ArsR family transcriptional regulator, virulence genes transcriptional regulator
MAKTTLELQTLREHAQDAASLMKILANENRLMLLCTLIENELSVGELHQSIDLSQSALSQHLASLREAGLVATRREGQTIFYRLQGDKAMRVIEVLRDIYCR